MLPLKPLERLREVLRYAVEPCDSSKQSPNKRYSSKCGYCLYAESKRAWTLRYKPFCSTVEDSVLAGNHSTKPQEASTIWLCRIHPVSISSEHQAPPFDAVMDILKLTELRYILKEAKSRVLAGSCRRKRQRVITGTRKDPAGFDMGPLLRYMLGQPNPSSDEVVRVIDMTMAYTLRKEIISLNPKHWFLTYARKNESQGVNEEDQRDKLHIAIQEFVDALLGDRQEDVAASQYFLEDSEDEESNHFETPRRTVRRLSRKRASFLRSRQRTKRPRPLRIEDDDDDDDDDNDVDDSNEGVQTAGAETMESTSKRPLRFPKRGRIQQHDEESELGGFDSHGFHSSDDAASPLYTAKEAETIHHLKTRRFGDCIAGSPTENTPSLAARVRNLAQEFEKRVYNPPWSKCSLVERRTEKSTCNKDAEDRSTLVATKLDVGLHRQSMNGEPSQILLPRRLETTTKSIECNGNGCCTAETGNNRMKRSGVLENMAFGPLSSDGQVLPEIRSKTGDAVTSEDELGDQPKVGFRQETAVVCAWVKPRTSGRCLQMEDSGEVHDISKRVTRHSSSENESGVVVSAKDSTLSTTKSGETEDDGEKRCRDISDTIVPRMKDLGGAVAVEAEAYILKRDGTLTDHGNHDQVTGEVLEKLHDPESRAKTAGNSEPKRKLEECHASATVAPIEGKYGKSQKTCTAKNTAVLDSARNEVQKLGRMTSKDTTAASDEGNPTDEEIVAAIEGIHETDDELEVQDKGTGESTTRGQALLITKTKPVVAGKDEEASVEGHDEFDGEASDRATPKPNCDHGANSEQKIDLKSGPMTVPQNSRHLAKTRRNRCTSAGSVSGKPDCPGLRRQFGDEDRSLFLAAEDGDENAMIFAGPYDERDSSKLESLWDGEHLSPNKPSATCNVYVEEQSCFSSVSVGDKISEDLTNDIDQYDSPLFKRPCTKVLEVTQDSRGSYRQVNLRNHLDKATTTSQQKASSIKQLSLAPPGKKNSPTTKERTLQSPEDCGGEALQGWKHRLSEANNNHLRVVGQEQSNKGIPSAVAEKLFNSPLSCEQMQSQSKESKQGLSNEHFSGENQHISEGPTLSSDDSSQASLSIFGESRDSEEHAEVESVDAQTPVEVDDNYFDKVPVKIVYSPSEIQSILDAAGQLVKQRPKPSTSISECATIEPASASTPSADVDGTWVRSTYPSNEIDLDQAIQSPSMAHRMDNSSNIRVGTLNSDEVRSSETTVEKSSATKGKPQSPSKRVWDPDLVTPRRTRRRRRHLTTPAQQCESPMEIDTFPIGSNDDLPLDCHWAHLDHSTAVSDYVYAGFPSLDFGGSLSSALLAVSSELARAEAQHFEDNEYAVESKIYSKTVKERRRQAEAEKIARQRDLCESAHRISKCRNQMTNRKKSRIQMEYDAFLSRAPVFVSRADIASFRCKDGDSCSLCSSSMKVKPVQVAASVLSPSVRPSNVKDFWIETDIDDEVESRKKNRVVKRGRRRGRQINKQKNMLMEIKHTLTFIEQYNRGYF